MIEALGSHGHRPGARTARLGEGVGVTPVSEITWGSGARICSPSSAWCVLATRGQVTVTSYLTPPAPHKRLLGPRVLSLVCPSGFVAACEQSRGLFLAVSLSAITSSPMHVVADRIAVFYLFLRPKNIPGCRLPCPCSADGLSHVLATVNTAAVSAVVRVSLRVSVFGFGGVVPTRGDRWVVRSLHSQFSEEPPHRPAQRWCQCAPPPARRLQPRSRLVLLAVGLLTGVRCRVVVVLTGIP